jgi:hypothetical protein
MARASCGRRAREVKGDEKAVVKEENGNGFILKVGSRSLASVGGRAARPLEQPGEQGPLSELIPCLGNPSFLI